MVNTELQRNPRIFGSVLHGKDTEDSDLDILVDPTQDTTLFDIARIEIGLRALGLKAQVLTPGGLPDSFKDRVLAEAAPL